MEEIIVGTLMLISFVLGAYIREPICFKKKGQLKEYKKAQAQTVVDKLENDEREFNDMLIKAELKRQEQIQAMYNYTEKDAIDEN